MFFIAEQVVENSIDRANSISWDRPRSTAVKFTEDKQGEKQDVNFVRHDTPHPRELKARHQKLFSDKHHKQHAADEQSDDRKDSTPPQKSRPEAQAASNQSDEEQSETSSVMAHQLHNSALT